MTAGGLKRSTVDIETLPGLHTVGPRSFRWVALGWPVLPAGATDASVVSKLTVALPVIVLHDFVHA